MNMSEKYNVELSLEDMIFIVGLCEHKLDYGGSPSTMKHCLDIYEKLCRIKNGELNGC